MENFCLHFSMRPLMSKTISAVRGTTNMHVLKIRVRSHSYLKPRTSGFFSLHHQPMKNSSHLLITESSVYISGMIAWEHGYILIDQLDGNLPVKMSIDNVTTLARQRCKQMIPILDLQQSRSNYRVVLGLVKRSMEGWIYLVM